MNKSELIDNIEDHNQLNEYIGLFFGLDGVLGEININYINSRWGFSGSTLYIIDNPIDCEHIEFYPSSKHISNNGLFGAYQDYDCLIILDMSLRDDSLAIKKEEQESEEIEFMWSRLKEGGFYDE